MNWVLFGGNGYIDGMKWNQKQRLFMSSRGTNNKGVCNVIRTHPSFHSLSFGYLPQPAHIMKQVTRPFTENVEKSLAFPSRWVIINNRNNF